MVVRDDDIECVAYVASSKLRRTILQKIKVEKRIDRPRLTNLLENKLYPEYSLSTIKIYIRDLIKKGLLISEKKHGKQLQLLSLSDQGARILKAIEKSRKTW